MTAETTGLAAGDAPSATGEPGPLGLLRARLVSPLPDDRPWGWLGPLLVTAFGTYLRFNRLRVPRAHVTETCREVLATCKITDINVQEPPVEEVIRQLFREQSEETSAVGA